MLVLGLVHSHLDQLVVAQRGVDGANHGFGRAAVADLHQRVQGIGERAQMAALEALQSRLGAHRTHSTSRRTPLLGLLTAFVLWFSVSCATTAPIEPAPFAPVPRAAEAPSAHPPVAIDEVENTDPASLLGRAVPESPSLLFARDVLDRRAAKLSAVEREGVARELVVAEAEHGISVLFSLALIEQESRFDPRAKGPTGSIGLMQLQPLTAREVARKHGLAWQSERTLHDPVQNVRLGLAYLAELRAKFGSTDHAMAAYNIGPNALRRLLDKRPLRHGPYLKKVHAKAEAMRGEFTVPEIAIGG